jgi:hypothetical protein
MPHRYCRAAGVSPGLSLVKLEITESLLPVEGALREGGWTFILVRHLAQTGGRFALQLRTTRVWWCAAAGGVRVAHWAATIIDHNAGGPGAFV